MSKRKNLVAVSGIIILAGVLLMSFIRQHYVAPIIMYHSVNPGAPFENRLVVSPQTFERQMSFLKRNHYRILTLEELGTLIKEKRRIPPRAVAITFDDGYKDNYTHAFPILKKYRIRVTLFVITNEIGRSDRLSWDEINQMQDSGLVTIGSHATGPDPLTKITSVEELKKQIFDSRRILEDRLGKKVNTFSYPKVDLVIE